MANQNMKEYVFSEEDKETLRRFNQSEMEFSRDFVTGNPTTSGFNSF